MALRECGDGKTYATITAAVAAAVSGVDDVVVYPKGAGYSENNIVVNKAISIYAYDWVAGNRPTIAVDFTPSATIGFTCNTNASTIRGLEIHSATTHGYACAVAGCIVEDCDFHTNGQNGTWSNSDTIYRRCWSHDNVAAAGFYDAGGTQVYECCIASANNTYGFNTPGCSLEQCTAYGNGTGGASYGIYVAGAGGLARNCISSGNTGYGIRADGGATEEYNCAYGNSTANYFGGVPGTGSIEVDPLMTNPGADDFTLQKATPCRDAGTATTPTIDFVGTTFVTDDMGAYAAPPYGMTSVTVVDRFTLEINWDAAVTNVGDVSDWELRLTSTAGALPSILTVDETTSTLTTLTLYPGLTPGASYEIEALNATIGGLPADPNWLPFTVSGALVPDGPDDVPGTYIRAILQAIGHQTNIMAGTLQTRLAKTLESADTTAYLESTYGWPDLPAGLWMEGRLYPFTGVVSGGVTGLGGPFRADPIEAGTLVRYDVASLGVYGPPVNPGILASPISQVENAWRGTTIRLSGGDDFEVVANVYGLHRPGWIPPDDWRNVLLTLAYADRAGAAIFEAVRHALNQYAVEVEVTIDPANPQRITATAGAGTFTDDDVTWWVRIDGTIYRVDGPADVGATGAGAWLELTAYETSYWAAADWSGLSAPETVTAECLAYKIEEPTPGPTDVPAVLVDPDRPDTDAGDPGIMIVWLKDGILTPTPGTYLQPTSAARPVGEPYGGHMMTDESILGSQVTGPFPIYLVDGTVLHDLAGLFSDQLPPGFWVVFRLDSYK